MVEVTLGELVTGKEATCCEETLRLETQGVPQRYKYVYKRRRYMVESSSAENWRRNGGQLIKSPGHESFSVAQQEILQPDEVVLQGFKGKEGSQQTKSTSPSAGPPVPRERPTLPRRAKESFEALPIFKGKSWQRHSPEDCSPEVARAALSGRGVTREEPSPIALARSLQSRKEKNYWCCEEPSPGKVNNVERTLESVKSGDMACGRSKELQIYDNMALVTLSPVIPLCLPNPHPRMEDTPFSENSLQGPQTLEKLQKGKRLPLREELLPKQGSTPEQDVRSSSGIPTPPTVRLLTTVTTKNATVRHPSLPPSEPLSCGIIPEVCMNPSWGFDQVPEPTYQAHTVDLPGSSPRGSLCPDSPKALSVFIDLSQYFLDSQKEVTTLNKQAVVSRALAEAPLLASESWGIEPASLASGVSSGHHLVFPSLIAGSSQKHVETCTANPGSLSNNAHAFPMQPSPPSNGHPKQNLQEKVMEHVHQEMHHVKDKVRRKKYTPKVKKAMKPKVPKIPKEKDLKRSSRSDRDKGSVSGRVEKTGSPEPEGQNPFSSFTELQPCNISEPANRTPSPSPTMVIDMKRIMRRVRTVGKQRRPNKNKLMTYVSVVLGLDPNDVAQNAIQNPPLTIQALLHEKQNLDDGMAQPDVVSLLSRELDLEISSNGSESKLMLRKAVVDQLTPEYLAELQSLVVRDKEVFKSLPVESSDAVIEDLNGAPSTSTSAGRKEHKFRPFVISYDQEMPPSNSRFLPFVDYHSPKSPPDVVQIPSKRDECVQFPCPQIEDVPTTPIGNSLIVELTMEGSPNPVSPLSPVRRCVENTEGTSSPDCGVLCIQRNTATTGVLQFNNVRQALLPQFDSVGSMLPSPQDPPKKSRPWKNIGQHRILDQPIPFTRMKRSDKVKYMRRLSNEYGHNAMMELMKQQLTGTQLSEVESLHMNKNASSKQDLQIVAYKGAVKDMVLYQAPLLWRRKVNFKFKPKVGLDSETLTMFRRLMIQGGAVEDDDTDDEKWEGIRNYWRNKADHFNNIMHQIQGDRTFSKWGGSVMDSLVGAFLTQNVSDFLSSSAFMSLRARFPASNATEFSTGGPGENEKPSDGDGAAHSSQVPNGENEKPSNGAAHSSQGPNRFPEVILLEQTSSSNLDSVMQDNCIDKSSSEMLVENFKRLQLAKALEPLLYPEATNEIAAETSTPSQSNVAMVEYIPNGLVSRRQDEVDEVVGEFLKEGSNIEHANTNAEQAITFSATQPEIAPEIAVERSQPRTPNRRGIAKAAAKIITQSTGEKAINSSVIEIKTALVGKSMNCLRSDDQAEITKQNWGEVSKVDIFVPRRRPKDIQRLSYVITRSEMDTEGVISSLPEATNDSTEEVGMEKILEEWPCPVTQCEANSEDPICPICPSTMISTSHEVMDDCVKEVGMDMALEGFPSPKNQSDIASKENSIIPTLMSSLHNAMHDSVEEVDSEEFLYPVTQSDANTKERPIRPTVISLHEVIDNSPEKVGMNKAVYQFQEPGPESCCNFDSKDLSSQVKPLDLQKLQHSNTKRKSTRKSSRIMDKVQYRLLSGSDRARWEQGIAVKSQRDKWEPLRSKFLADEGYAHLSTTHNCIDWEAVRQADVAEVADVIKDRGMNNLLAGRIKSCLERIHQDQCGSLDLEWIRKLPPDDAKDFLLSIRGLGLKSVECIRLLTLHHPSFPVDTNVGRIAVRLGWVPLEPLPEETQLHLLESYPIQAHIQQYLWPRLCKLDQQTLYELHYQMITFGKVFCTKSKPNCNACPMRSECKHFASAYASAKPLLTGPEERGPSSTMLAVPSTEPDLQSSKAPQILPVEVIAGCGGSCNPIIEEPSTPEETHLVDDTLPDIEDGLGSFIIKWGTKSTSEAQVSSSINYLNTNSRLTMDHPSDILNVARLIDSVKARQLDSNMGVTIENVAEEPTSQVALSELQSQELILLPPQAASIPVPQLKNIQRLRTVHYVYELPDDHPLLSEMDKRLADDPCFYLLAIWSPDEVPESMPKINDEDVTNPFASCSHGEGPETVKGTLLVPCRTAMRGCFPLNGTYFQVNEVFADHVSSMQPIEVPRTLLWSLQRRFVYFGTAVTNLFRGMTQEEIQCCFKKGYVCVRAFDQKTRKPKLLAPRLHQSSAHIKPQHEPKT